MSENWQAALKRWLEAGVVDGATADGIRAFEAKRSGVSQQSRLALIVFGFGGLLLTAGILLFVAAHWDTLSPGARFTLVLALVGALHVGGAIAARASAGLSATLHLAGTAALGAGIFLSGQIFHLGEHWTGALMLWSIGAAVGVYLLRDWPQVLWLALLAPAWLWGEWMELQPHGWGFHDQTPALVGLLLVACAYLAARPPDSVTPGRRALAWLGAIALIPAAAGLAFAHDSEWTQFGRKQPEISGIARIVGWSLAIVLPLALAWFLRGREAIWMLAALAWALLLSQMSARSDAGELATYAMLAAGAAGFVFWGLRDQQRLAINVGVLGFALAVLGFYFSSLYDRLGRSLGLIGLGILFIGGGWLLERARRRLVARVQRSGA